MTQWLNVSHSGKKNIPGTQWHAYENYTVAQQKKNIFGHLILNRISKFNIQQPESYLQLEHNMFPTDQLKLSPSCAAPIHLFLSPFHLAYPEIVFILAF